MQKKKKKKKEILETRTSQYTNTSDVLKRLFLLGKKRSKLLENCYNTTLNITSPPQSSRGRKCFLLNNLNQKFLSYSPQGTSWLLLLICCHLMALRELKNKPFLIRMSFLCQQFAYMELRIMRNPYNDVRYHK